MSQEVQLVGTELEPTVGTSRPTSSCSQLPDHIRPVAHHEVSLVRAELRPTVEHVETDLELLEQLRVRIRRVAHDEVALVPAELEAKVKRVEIGLGMSREPERSLSMRSVCCIAAAVLGLATAVTAWLSALIVAVALVAIAGLLALGGNSGGVPRSSHRRPS